MAQGLQHQGIDPDDYGQISHEYESITNWYQNHVKKYIIFIKCLSYMLDI